MTAVASRSTPTIHRVERVMGTAFGITVLDDIDPAVVAAAFALLHEVDARFSTYRPDSEVSLLGRGALDLDDATSEVREVFARCAELTELTDGSFTIDPTGDAGPGIADPSGLVKGWAIDRVTTMLRMAGATGFCVNGGGDLACGAGPRPGGTWRVGIRHPVEAHEVAVVLDICDAAIATSATYERGQHIWGAGSGSGSARLLSATVVGPELGTADALATAVFVDGTGAPRWLADTPGYDALVITADHRVRWTPGFDALIVRAPATTAGDRPFSMQPGADSGSIRTES